MGILKLARATALGLVLGGIASCGGGSGGGGEPGATTFAKVYGENSRMHAASVLPTNDGYRVIGSTGGNTDSGGSLTLFDLDRNGNLVGSASVSQSGNALAGLNSRSLLPDGYVSAGIDINRTRNLYTLSLVRDRFNTDLSQSPFELWRHDQVMDYGTTPWRSDDSAINGYPARLLSAGVKKVETAVSAGSYQGTLVLVRESAYVETVLRGTTKRSRLMLFHYDASGGLQSIRQLDERPVPYGAATATERTLFNYWHGYIELAMGDDGSYAVAIPKHTATNPGLTTEYTLSYYDAGDGLRWSQTLGPWPTGHLPVTIAQMRLSGVNLLLYTDYRIFPLKPSALRYLALDGSGNTLWDHDISSLGVNPIGLACEGVSGCLFAALTDNPRHLLLWNELGSQVADIDLTATGISNDDIPNKQLEAWPDGNYRLLLGNNHAEPANDERYLFHIHPGLTYSLSGQGDSLWRRAGDVRAQALALSPYGYYTLEYGRYHQIFDSTDSLLLDMDSLYARYSGRPISVANLADGRSLILEQDGGLIFLRDGRIDQRLIADARQWPRSITTAGDGNSFVTNGYYGWAGYDLAGNLLWSGQPAWADSYPRDTYYHYGSTDSAVFPDGDLLLSGYISGPWDLPVLLYAARVGNDGSLRWQHTWSLADDRRPQVVPLVIDDGLSGEALIAIANTAPESQQPAISLLRLDPASGGITQRRDLSPVGAGGEIIRPRHYLRLVETPQGGLWLGFTSSALVSHETATDELGNPESIPYGGDNMALIRLTADLQPDRLRIYGAGGDERLNDIRILPDGSLLVAGDTSSFALGWDGSSRNSDAVVDGWILRLDASGNISDGCQALLASFDDAAASQYLGAVGGSAFPESTLLTGTLTLQPIELDTQLSTRPASLPMASRTLESARMCLGSVTPPPLPEPPAGGDYTLTLTIEGGPGAGEVYSLPAPPEFQCINSSEPTTICTHSYPAGTPVSLVGQAYGATTLSWSGCDMANSDGCSLTMDTDRQVTATFSP